MKHSTGIHGGWTSRMALAMTVSFFAPASLLAQPQPDPTAKVFESGINEEPPVRIEPPLMDLGVLMPGTKAPGKFTVTNTSQETLIFKEALPSCSSCTHVTHDSDRLGPGESTDFYFELDAGYKLGKQVQPKRIYVFYGGYLKGATFEFTYEVAHGVRVDPPRLQKEEIDKTRDGELTLNSVDSAPFRVIRVAGLPPVYSDGFDPAKDQPRNTYKVKWDFKNQPLPPWLLIETDHPKAAVVEVDLYHPEIRAAERSAASGLMGVGPGGWNFGLLKGGEPRTYKIRINGMYPRDWQTLPQARKSEIERKIIAMDPTAVPNVSVPFSQDVTARIVKAELSDKPDKVIHYTIEITPRAGFEGLLLTPLYFKYNDGQIRTWVFGRVESPKTAASTNS